MAQFWRGFRQLPRINLPQGDLHQQTKDNLVSWGIFSGLSTWCVLCSPLAAQITPDGSLGTETTTINNVTEITGGTRANNNLFHSFQDFSISTGNIAFFNNALEISNIISRVTGGNLSNIDGLIRANGNANLILLNPQGISLGNNVALDIGGSFLGSTAKSIVFDDGRVFNTDLSTQPLLSVSTPLGLQLGRNSAPIQVSGIADSTSSLEVAPGNTFALVGNGINFTDKVITAEAGRIDLGSVAEGQVSITEIDAGWQLGYEGVTQFADVQLLDTALLNPNSLDNPSGGIQIQGDNIRLERSQINAQTLGNATGGSIRIGGTTSLVLSGTTSSGVTSSQISNDVATDATGQGGSVEITTGELTINAQSFISSMTFGAGNAGDINIAATDINIEGSGFQEFQQQYQVNALNGTIQPGDRLTGIFAGTLATGAAGDIIISSDSLNLNNGSIIFNPVFTSGRGGDINITATDINLNASALQIGGGLASTPEAFVGDINLSTERLQVSEGANVINLTFGVADGGNINIIASDSIDLSNTPPESILPTGIVTNSSLGSGQGGDINIQANTITMNNAGIVSNSGALLPPNGELIPFGGTGGNITIQANESIEASGVLINPADPSRFVGAGVGTTTFTEADGGDLTIATGKLIIRDGASFSTAAFGIGNGGELTINATESVELLGNQILNEAFGGTLPVGLLATSNNLQVAGAVNGSSGNISITTPQLLVSEGARIDVQSFGTGRAGSLDIVADSILLSNLGTLSANTISGTGGDVRIRTNTLKLDRGLINASVFGSGVSGNIDINAQESVEVVGSGFEFLQELFFNPNFLSAEFLASLDTDLVNQGILAATLGTGEAGEISITTPDLSLREGALIATATFGDGLGGKTVLNVGQTLTIDASIISASTVFAGQGGDIEIDTNQLGILQGAQLTTESLGSGNSGNIIINAAESVTVSGESDNNVLVSSIGAGADLLPIATGNGGDITINTPLLSLNQGGDIAIGSIGTGDAGSLTVNAATITLDNQSAITANTMAGGANIFLNANNIFLSGGSLTTATAAGTGNGGNITISANNLVALEGSQLTADAFRGMGGNITIDTQGLFVCGDCVISASSSLGVDGIVNIETLQPTALDTSDIPQQPTQAEEIVAVACPAQKGASNSQLTITGRGGLPRRPQELLGAQSIIEFEELPTQVAERSPVKNSLPLPASNWYQDAQGNVVLTAQGTGNSLPQNADCQF